MQYLIDKLGTGFTYGVLAAVALILLLILLLAMRAMFGGRIRPAGGHRVRPVRLGVVDAFDLGDRQRQLVLVRRDNVEHLVLIGGPNDVLIESNIVRAAGAPLETRRSGEDSAPPPFVPSFVAPAMQHAPEPLPPAMLAAMPELRRPMPSPFASPEPTPAASAESEADVRAHDPASRPTPAVLPPRPIPPPRPSLPPRPPMRASTLPPLPPRPPRPNPSLPERGEAKASVTKPSELNASEAMQPVANEPSVPAGEPIIGAVEQAPAVAAAAEQVSNEQPKPRFAFPRLPPRVPDPRPVRVAEAARPSGDERQGGSGPEVRALELPPMETPAPLEPAHVQLADSASPPVDPLDALEEEMAKLLGRPTGVNEKA